MGILRFAQIATLGFRNDLSEERAVSFRLPRILRRPRYEADCFFRPVIEDHGAALKLAQSL